MRPLSCHLSIAVNRHVPLCWMLSATVAWAAAASPAPDFSVVDQYLNACLVKNRVPGIAIAVVEGAEIVYLKGYGIADPSGRPMTPQTPFLLGSTSKSFAALALLQLVEQGKLDLDAPVKKYLPWFFMRDGAAGRNASERITLRQLLHHTSGIPNPTGETALVHDHHRPDALEMQVRSFARDELARPPGSGMEYANANYQIAGLAVQTVSGMSIEDYISGHIFRPLEMHHSHTSPEAALPDGLATGYRYWFTYPISFSRQPYPRGCFPSGFMISSAEDLGHWLIAHMNNGLYHGTSVISSNGMARLHRPDHNNYGMGWEVRPDTLEHGGHLSCFGSYLYIDTMHHRGVAVLFNANHGERLHALYDIAPNIGRLLAGQPLAEPSDEHPYRNKLIQTLALLTGTGIWFLWSLLKVLQWSAQTKPPPHGFHFWFFLAVPLAFEIAAVSALYMAVPVKFSIALLHAPDLMMLVGVSGMLLVCWGVIRTAWIVALGFRVRYGSPKGGKGRSCTTSASTTEA
jgi:CubicO group peptidase (beta-lactamase class C family)